MRFFFLWLTVVIDRRHDVNASTGSFEMIYKQIIPKTPAYMGLNLQLRGHRITPKSTAKKDRLRILPVKPVQNVLQVSRLAASAVPKPTTGPVIMDLLECLQFDTKMQEEEELRARTAIYRKSGFSTRPNLRYDFARKKSYIIAKTGEFFRRNGGPKYLTEGETYIDNIEDWERATTSFFQNNYASTLSSLTTNRNNPYGSGDLQTSPNTSSTNLRYSSKAAYAANYCDDFDNANVENNTATSENPTGYTRYSKLTANSSNKTALSTNFNNFYTLGLSLRKQTTPRSPMATRMSANFVQSTEDLIELGKNC